MDSDDSDYDLEYESYESEGTEDNFELENLYYNAKSKKEDSLSDAIDDFKNLIEIHNSTENEDDGNFAFKSNKQICKCYFKLKNYDQFLNFYMKLLKFKNSFKQNTFKIPKKYFEDSIKKIIKYVSNKNFNTPSKVQLNFHLSTLETLNLQPCDKLWFQHQMKIGQLRLNCKEFDKVEQVVAALLEAAGSASDAPATPGPGPALSGALAAGEDGKSQPAAMADSITTTTSTLATFNSVQLLQIFSLEIQLYTCLNDFPKLQKIYNKCLAQAIQFDFCNVFDQGIIKELSGKINLRKLNYSQALTDFFEAFKSFDECGHDKRILSLKLYVLVGMLMGSNISPFDSQEAKPYKNSLEMAEILQLYEAYRDLDTVKFDTILISCIEQMEKEDKIQSFYFKRLQVYLWYKSSKVLIDSEINKHPCLKFIKLPLADFTDRLKISSEKAVLLISYAITEKKLNAKFDQVDQILRVETGTEVDLNVQMSELVKMLKVKQVEGDKILKQMAIVKD